MSEFDEEQQPAWEAQINALLDGELDEAGMAALERAAQSDAELARALADARQLKNLLSGMPSERAPRRLRRKLLGIAGPGWLLPTADWWRRAALIACIPLVVVVLSLDKSSEPSEAEIMQGRQELALALSYLGRASQTTNAQISSTIDHAMVGTVAESTVRTLEQQIVLPKEYLL
ncbi:MAG: hypothetical protein ABJ308_18925 [Halieaceae bacterium]